MAQLELENGTTSLKYVTGRKSLNRSGPLELTFKIRTFALFFGSLFLAWAVVQGQASKKTPAENSSNTVKLTAKATVDGCINVEAVLLAKKPAAMLFGGFVAENYAVVKTTVSNRCDDEQFILHDIYFDYRHWALSGVYPELPTTLCPNDADPTGKNQPAAQAGSQSKKDSEQHSGAPPAARGGNNSAPGNDKEATPSVTATPGSTDSTPTSGDHTSMGTCPGQVATVGATDVQDQDTEDAVFSPRNKVVKAITLIGQVAEGYAFIWGGDAAKGIGAYNSAFVENVTKLWPDRRIDQEKNILSLGYRTDRSTAIAKDDHGSYYAFFPLKVFLSPTLSELFLNNPAVFMNPAEALFEYSFKDHQLSRSVKKQQEQTVPLTELLLRLTDGIRTKFPEATNPARGTSDAQPDQSSNSKAIKQDDPNIAKITALLTDLGSPCPRDPCPFGQKSSDFQRILAEKYLLQRASLNSVQIVVRGVMTVSLDAVPPTIDSVAFDNEKDGASLWSVEPEATPAGGSAAGGKDAKAAAQAGVKSATGKDQPAASPATPVAPPSEQATAAYKAKTLTGTISGKFLANGTPSVESVTVPTDPKAEKAQYIGTVQGDAAKSSDSTLPFSMQLLKSLPNGSKLTIMVTRDAPISGTDSESSSPGTGKQVTSNQYVYTVAFDTSKTATTTAPHINDIVMDNETKIAVWQNTGKDPIVRSGKVTGTDLADGTVKVADFEVGGKTTDYKSYIETITTRSSTATELDFNLELLKTVPDGSRLTLTVEKKSGSNTETSNSFNYPVKKPALKPASKPKPKPTPKPTESGPGKKPSAKKP